MCLFAVCVLQSPRPIRKSNLKSALVRSQTTGGTVTTTANRSLSTALGDCTVEVTVPQHVLTALANSSPSAEPVTTGHYSGSSSKIATCSSITQGANTASSSRTTTPARTKTGSDSVTASSTALTVASAAAASTAALTPHGALYAKRASGIRSPTAGAHAATVVHAAIAKLPAIGCSSPTRSSGG